MVGRKDVLAMRWSAQQRTPAENVMLRRVEMKVRVQKSAPGKRHTPRCRCFGSSSGGGARRSRGCAASNAAALLGFRRATLRSAAQHLRPTVDTAAPIQLCCSSPSPHHQASTWLSQAWHHVDQHILPTLHHLNHQNRCSEHLHRIATSLLRGRPLSRPLDTHHHPPEAFIPK